MGEKEEQFPFQQFIGALQEEGDLKKGLKTIIKAICGKNIYWTYSSISTITEIVKGKDQDPEIKCRSLDAAKVLLETCQYPIVTLVEVYLLPLLQEVAAFAGKKSKDAIAYYFQQTHGVEDSEKMRRNSMEYVQRAVEIIYQASKIKPYRTVQTQQLKQQSLFSSAFSVLFQKGLKQPERWKWSDPSNFKQYRKIFLQRLRKFQQHSQPWTQFLLVNLLQEVSKNKKQLLQLRQLLPFGQGYLCSAVINLCQDQLLQPSDDIQMKRKYLSLLTQLVRNGDIEAIVMIQNSQFISSFVAHISKLQGQLGVNQGEKIYPQIKASKTVKREFYCDFLRCLENWATSIPEQCHMEENDLKNLYKFLKVQKKFKFPDNIHLNRYQKQLLQNLTKNKQRNDKLIELLEGIQDSKQSQSHTPTSKVSNILQRTTLLAPNQLQTRLQQAKKCIKQLTTDEKVFQKNYQILGAFKDNWITYLQALDLEGADDAKIEGIIMQGEKCVQQIQMLAPHYLAYSKGKINFRDLKERVKEVLELQDEISANYSSKSKSINISKSMVASKLAKSRMNRRSKLGGRQLLSKIKAKSKVGDKSHLNISKALIDRSQMMEKSRCFEKSRSKLDQSKQELGKQLLSNQNGDQSMNKIAVLLKQQQKIINRQEKSTFKQASIIPIKTQQNSITPRKIQQKQKQILNNLQTIKKQAPKFEDQDEQQRIVRIQDYQVTNSKPLRYKQRGNRLSSSRQRGSRLLLRNSPNKSSRLQHSRDSEKSEDRKSSKSLKKIKQTSLFKKNSSPKMAFKTKASLCQQQFFDGKIQINETIELNGNLFKEVAEPQKRQSKQKEIVNQIDKFKDGVESISSIHSNSVLRVFQNSAEKILDITEHYQQGSKQNNKNFILEEAEYSPKEYISPIVGDYYTPAQKNHGSLNIESVFKKKSETETKKQIKQDRSQSQKQRPTSNKRNLFVLEQSKIAKRIEQQKQSQKTVPQSPRNTSNKTQKAHRQTLKSQTQKKPADIEQIKERQIIELQQKIRQLQRQALLMKNKLAQKDVEIKSIKSQSKYGSQRGFAHFTTASQSHRDKSEKSSQRGSSVGNRKVQSTKFQRQVEGEFKQYLERIKGNTFRKSLLKLKCLVHKTDEIQIGCLSQRGDKNLQCTLYITPHRYTLIDFSISVIHDSCLKMKVTPQLVPSIPAKKQQKVHLTIEILKIPFSLPEVEINYKADSEYSSNYNRLTLPLCFAKFCQIRPLQARQSQKDLNYVRSDNFKLNSKIVKLQKLSDSFPGFTIVPPSKDRQQILMTASCTYPGSSFNILMNLSERHCWLQGFLKRGDIKPMNFLICTLRHILDSSRK